MQHFPAFLDLRGRSALVVGGGAAAAHKAGLLLKAGAAVTVAAPRVGPELAALAEDGAVRLTRRGFVGGDVAGRAVVVAATGRADVDERVAAAARAAGVPVNVVDRPDLSSFIMPAIVDRDGIVVAVSSGGAAPVLARRVRAAVEAALPARLGRLARFAGGFRGAVKARIADAAGRRRFWERFFDGPLAEAVLAGDEGRAREGMLKLVNGRAAARAPTGAVDLIGAGPGDPDLLTLRALRLIQQADVVVYDRLVGPGILDHARRDAERICVGKAKGDHSLPQDGINALLVRLARAGKRVARLKGGDPFVFGRGGEELDHLRRAGIEVAVVPGITAALGCAAAVGMALTHRDHASAVTFVSGHAADSGGVPDLDWSALAGPRRTLVVYMGVSAAGAIAGRLVAQGLDPATPAAIVENGTRPEQKVAVGTVAGLGDMVRDHSIVGPAVIVVGDVARLAADAAATARWAIAV